MRTFFLLPTVSEHAMVLVHVGMDRAATLSDAFLQKISSTQSRETLMRQGGGLSLGDSRCMPAASVVVDQVVPYEASL